jgi:SAM-dependent methyltransferase
VDEYSRATNGIGLWRSEEKVFTRLFKPEDVLLEVGCGAGRIAFGLWELGYHRLLGVDIARAMIEEARRINTVLEYGVSFRLADATRLPFGDSEFDGAIFGFNGLMTIPQREKRREALCEIRRVVRPGAWFVFTTHDRAREKYRDYWAEQEKLWQSGSPLPGLFELGDRLLELPHGSQFIHVPMRDEVREDLAATGWRLEVDTDRALLALEDERVTAFSDECVFWVAQKPAE